MPKIISKNAGYLAALAVLALVAVTAKTLAAQNTGAQGERWLHVSVTNHDPQGERVRVNLPFSIAEGVLGSIKHDRLDHGIIKVNHVHMDDIDFRKLYASLKDAKDGEFVTVESRSCDLRVAKENGFLIVKAHDKEGRFEKHFHDRKHFDTYDSERDGSDRKDLDRKGSEKKDSAVKDSEKKDQDVYVRVPLEVVDALFSAGPDELNIVAALHALASHGDTELVTVKDSEKSVRIWVDAKNTAE
jgi:hypothetical protein